MRYPTIPWVHREVQEASVAQSSISRRLMHAVPEINKGNQLETNMQTLNDGVSVAFPSLHLRLLVLSYLAT